MREDWLVFRLIRCCRTVADASDSDLPDDRPIVGHLITLLAVSLLAGCAPPDSAKIVGQWEIAEATKLSKKIVNDDDTDSGDSRMTVQFDRSGKLRTNTAMGNIKSTKQGTWRSLGYDEPTGRMQIECTLGMQTTEHDIEFRDDDTIVWIPPNLAGTSQKVRFIRAKN